MCLRGTNDGGSGSGGGDGEGVGEEEEEVEDDPPLIDAERRTALSEYREISTTSHSVPRLGDLERGEGFVARTVRDLTVVSNAKERVPSRKGELGCVRPAREARTLPEQTLGAGTNGTMLSDWCLICAFPC